MFNIKQKLKKIVITISAASIATATLIAIQG
jgi:hypothetical protein